MTAKNIPAPLATVHAAEVKISEMEDRTNALKSRRAALAIDPGKDLEKEITAKMKAEADIDAELVPLELALSHLKGGIEQQWEDVQSFYLADVQVALKEVQAISEDAITTGTAFLETLFPCEENAEFRKVFKEPVNSFSPLLLKPLGNLTRWMRGVSEAVTLKEEIECLCGGWGRGSLNPTISTQQAYISALREFMDSYPSRKSEVKVAITEMETRFPTADPRRQQLELVAS